MSTITKERLEQLASFRGAPVTRQEEQELARIALASLEAEPVITVGDDGGDALAYRRLIQEFAPGTKLFTTPPAPVSVPEMKPVDLDEGFEEWYSEGESGADSVAPGWFSEAMKPVFLGTWRACRAAMLQGAKPVTTAYKLPAEAVYGYFAFNDHHGEEFFKKREDAIAFCKEAIEEYRQENAEEGCDPDEVRRTCWGIIMQEGTDFEVDNEGHIDYALTPELAGDSPVIPDGWVMVPVEPTYQMCEAMGLQWESPRFPDRYKAMLAAVKK